MNIFKTFREIGYVVVYSVGAILVVIFTPLLVILFLPIYIFRYCVQLAAWVWIPEPHSMLSMVDAVVASDEIYTNPKNSIIIYNASRGFVNPVCLEKVLSKIINIKVNSM